MILHDIRNSTISCGYESFVEMVGRGWVTECTRETWLIEATFVYIT